MGTRFKFGVVCFSFLVTVLLVVGALLGKSEQREGAYRPLAVYTEVLARIKSDYVEEPDITRVTQGALQGLVEYLDSVSSYLAPEEYEEYLERLESVDGGSGLATGMVVRKVGAYTSVLTVLPGSPADKAGIRADDLVDAIDDISTRVMPPAYLLASLSGDPGTTVRLMVRPSSDYDAPAEHTLERYEPVLPEVASRMLDSQVGYVDADVLGPEHVEQVSAAVRQLEADGAESLVLDLRGNAGGSAEDGIRLADLFLAKGRITSLQGQNFQEAVSDATAATVATDLPVAVVVDRPTSGGAEIAAASIQQNQRGKLVGESTSGVASKLQTLELGDGAALILSVAKYYGPGGKSIHGEGLEPDSAVPQRVLRRYREVQRRRFDTPEARQKAEEEAGDPFLDLALETLRQAE